MMFDVFMAWSGYLFEGSSSKHTLCINANQTASRSLHRVIYMSTVVVYMSPAVCWVSGFQSNRTSDFCG